MKKMRTLSFYKVNPGGNTTIFVLGRVQPGERAGLARRLLSAEHLQAEQVGFLDLNAQPARLEMMGGEFCGNASRAAALVMRMENMGLTQTQNAGDAVWTGQLGVSGAARPLSVWLKEEREAFHCGSTMPMPESAPWQLAPGLGLVRLPGITHLCLDERLFPFPHNFDAESARLRHEFGLEHEEACGCLWYHPETLALKPVVWVRSTASTVFESACGSGSLALALWLTRAENELEKKREIHIAQPSGKTMGVRLTGLSGAAARGEIFGPVALIARGEAFMA